MLPENWSRIIASKFHESNRWADFNCNLNKWKMLKRLYDLGFIEDSDLPDEPIPANYSNNSDPSTQC